jgi:hypothetical protein
VLKERVKLNGLILGGKFELKDGKLLIVNIAQVSSVLVYDWLKAINTEVSELDPIVRYGETDGFTLNVVSFDVSGNMDSASRSIFLVNLTRTIVHL